MVATKWLVSDEYCNFGICSTRADAEELILSIAEEAAYYDYCEEIICGKKQMTTEQYFNYIWALEDLEGIWTMDDNGKWHQVNRQTSWSAILDAALHDELFIDEVWCYTED